MVGMNEPCSTFAKIKAQVLIRTHMPTFIHTNPNSNRRTKLDMFQMIILDIIQRSSIHHPEHAEYLSHQEMEDLTHKQALQGGTPFQTIIHIKLTHNTSYENHLLILTTNSGVMHHKEAKENRIGGKLLAYVY